jgi:hypothetical protein
MKVNQAQLAAALGGGKHSVSVPLISSWESRSKPVIPPAFRLEDYSTFFATTRSFDGQAGRLLSPDELTQQERAARDELARELRHLRAGALRAAQADSARPVSASEIAESLNAGPWRFRDGNSITIVCAHIPQDMLSKMPYSNPLDPDYIAMYRYSDLDALFELHGHVRAANPTSQVDLRVASGLVSDDYSAHLISLGGVDWNSATSSVLDRLQLPVKQIADWGELDGAYFEVDWDGSKSRHRPLLDEAGGRRVLREDVALFARAPNPFNRKRLVTICNGMYGSGVYGAVRALTDARFRDRNTEYVQERFAGSEAFCILTRVTVENGTTLTPDWSLAETRLFEWSRP